MPIEDNTNLNILMDSIKDLKADIKALPTRHEFESLNARFDKFEDKFERYVLISDFNNNKGVTDDRLGKIESFVDVAKANKIPAWLHSIGVSAITVVLTMILGHLNWPNQNATQALPPAPAIIKPPQH